MGYRMESLRPRILVADDEEGIRFVLREILTREGYWVEEAVDGQQALDKASVAPFDLAILDLRMPKKDGMTVLRELKRLHPRIIVLIITAFGSGKVAREAILEGAYDYFTKPFDLQEIRIVVRRAIEKFTLMQQIDDLRAHIDQEGKFENLIGACPAIKEVFRLVDRVAESDVTVLILGESGTGKELIASAIHQRSARATKPMVKVNCVAIPEALLESELFGHERGSFTGAIQQKIGRIEAANGGTLFLDEIGDMPLSLQGKILRVLQERELERVGGNKSIKVDIRLICATNKNLQQAVENKEFREDLFFRVNVLPIYLPPLRYRREDLPLLIDHFIRLYNPRLGKQIQGVAADALEMMMNYSWPGNVRELENTIQRAMILTNSEILTAQCLSMSIRGQTSLALADAPAPEAAPKPAEEEKPLGEFLAENDFSIPLSDKVQSLVDEAERRLILNALRQTGGHRQATADLLGISRKSLHNKMVKFNLFREATGSGEPISGSDEGGEEAEGDEKV